jgi:hypothetical protein
MQWPLGTVSALRVPADRRLLEFDVPDGVLFRVRVVSVAVLKDRMAETSLRAEMRELCDA